MCHSLCDLRGYYESCGICHVRASINEFNDRDGMENMQPELSVVLLNPDLVSNFEFNNLNILSWIIARTSDIVIIN